MPAQIVVFYVVIDITIMPPQIYSILQQTPLPYQARQCCQRRLQYNATKMNITTATMLPIMVIPTLMMPPAVMAAAAVTNAVATLLNERDFIQRQQ